MLKMMNSTSTVEQKSLLLPQENPGMKRKAFLLSSPSTTMTSSPTKLSWMEESRSLKRPRTGKRSRVSFEMDSSSSGKVKQTVVTISYNDWRDESDSNDDEAEVLTKDEMRRSLWYSKEDIYRTLDMRNSMADMYSHSKLHKEVLRRLWQSSCCSQASDLPICDNIVGKFRKLRGMERDILEEQLSNRVNSVENILDTQKAFKHINSEIRQSALSATYQEFSSKALRFAQLLAQIDAKSATD